MVGVRIGSDMRQIAVASPAYIARAGRPETPKDLHAHKCLRWRWPGRASPYNWEFFKDGAWFEVEVDGPLILSEQSMTIDAALDGMGIAFLGRARAAPPDRAGEARPAPRGLLRAISRLLYLLPAAAADGAGAPRLHRLRQGQRCEAPRAGYRATASG